MALLDRVIFLPAQDGTADFIVASAVRGYQTPVAAGAVNGTTYSYAAEQRSHAGIIIDWEVGQGVWTASTNTLSRTTVLFSSQSNSKVNFSEPPQVMITALAEDFVAVLSSNLTINVSTTGSDSTGDGSSAKPFATLQKAIDFAAKFINLGNGNTLTISLGAGSFAGAGLKQIAGSGFVYINGAGVGSTTITAGTGSQLFDGGPCLALLINGLVPYYINNLTLDNSAGTSNCILMGGGDFFIGQPVPSGLGPGDYTPGTVNFKGNNTKYMIEVFGGQFADSPSSQLSTIGVSGTNVGMYKVSDNGFISAQSSYTMTGTPSFSMSFALCYNNGTIAANNFVSSGSATGVRFDVHSNGVISGTGGNINLFPGNSAGSAASGGQYAI